jgi:RNA polymerase sigma factor (sigma-70 family)
MAAGPEILIRNIRRLVIRPELARAPDATLLARFIADKDQRAFAALVDRHGPLVLHVCRRVLGNAHDAEDAFQATFLVLARKANAVQPREALTAWLHGVAHRVALKARSARARQLREAQPLPGPPADPRPDPLAELSARELLALVDEEVRRLPTVYRLPVLLCCLEGRSQEEAARQLGWTPGSVKGRLERGRARLHQRLVRRGLTLSAALAAAALSGRAGSASALGPRVAATVRAALEFAAGPTARGAALSPAAGLAGEVVRGMALPRMKCAVALVLAAGLLTTGFLLPAPAPLPSTADSLPVWSAPPPPEEDPAPVALAANERDEADGHREVSGRVLDPAGRPFAGARLYLGYAPRRYEPEATAHHPAYPLRARSGIDGRFQFVFSRSELDERYLDASRPVVVAVADGYGLDWAEIGEPTEHLALNLTLAEDLPLEGRILDQDRQPVRGARVAVRDISGDPVEGLTSGLGGNRGSTSCKSCRGPLPGQAPQVTTDADGRFRLTGLGRDRLVTLAVEGPALPLTVCTAATRPCTAIPPSSPILCATFDLVAPAPRTIRGVVRDRASGKAVAGVRMSDPASGSTTSTDKDGRFELLGYPSPNLKEYIVRADPQGDHPFFTALAQLGNPPGREPLSADFELVRGILLQGRVTDGATGKPPKRAQVEYYPLFPNAHSATLTKLDHLVPASSGPLQPDGSYRVRVLPGPGIVLVAASPRDSYATALLEERELMNLVGPEGNQGGGSWFLTANGGGAGWKRCVDRYNALALIRPDEKAESLTLDFTVQPAPGLRGTVVGPDGKELSGVRVRGLTSMPDPEVLPGASFTVEGLHPRRTRELSFHHQEKGLGKVVTLRGDRTEPLTVRLEPYGMVEGRMVDKRGQPVAEEVVRFTRDDVLVARTKTDREGGFGTELLPGFKYRLRVGSTHPRLKGVADLDVAPGQIIDLGVLVLDD